MSSEAENYHVQKASLILLFGCAGTGKTSFVNVARGGNAETEVGMRNATQGILTSEPFYVDENQVTIIDVPGFNDARLTVIEVLKSLSDLLSTLSSKNKITGFLYMHNITDTRVGGASLRNMNAFKTICGAESLKNAVYVTNMWSDPPTQNQLKREEELRESDDFFGWPLSQGAQMARHTNTKESAHNIIRLLLPKQPTVTKLWKQLVDERLGLAETDVGHVFEQEFKQDGLYQQQLKELADLKGKAAALEDEDRFKRQDANGAAHYQTTNPESGYHDLPILAIDPLAGLQATMENQEYEEERRSKGAVDHMVRSWSNHQEKSKKQDERIEEHIARIEAATSANQQGYAAPMPAQTSWLDMCLAKIPTFGWMGLRGSAPLDTVARAPATSRSAPVAIDGKHRSTTHPTIALGPPTGNVGSNFGSPHPVRSPRFQHMGHREEQVSGGPRSRQPGGRRVTHDEREGRIAASSKLNQDHEVRNAVGRRASQTQAMNIDRA